MSKECIEEFAKSSVECLYDYDIIGISKKKAIESVVSEIDSLLKLNDEKTLKRRHAHFKIPDIQINDYEENFYNLNNTQTVLAGIRHLNGSKDLPFVHLMLGFNPVSADIETLKEFASKQFYKFSPKFLTVWIKPSLDLDFSKYQAIKSRLYMVGSTSNIRKMETPSNYGKVTLEKITTEFDFNWYSNAYEEFHRLNPELKNWVSITDREDINRCISDELIYRVLIDGVLAGIIGAQNDPLLGEPSVYMTELLLLSRYKGQGLAVALQRKFIDQLPKQYKYVWGTIDAKNLPSLKTSQRVGRLPIRSEYFINLD